MSKFEVLQGFEGILLVAFDFFDNLNATTISRGS